MYRSVICFELFVFLLVAAALSGPAYALTIPEAKLLADDEPVTLDARCVTYAAADVFYVEEDSRAMGIRVEKPAHGLTPGMRADVAGTMKTNTARERYILATSALQNGEGSIEPVGMTNLSLGGENWHVEGTRGQKGVSGAMGLNNIGLLVRIWGAFEKVDDTTFTVDDGSGPITCKVPVGTYLRTTWQSVSLTGVCSASRLSSSIFPPLILVRDITNTYGTLGGEMVYIPADLFLMGNNGSEGWTDPAELPQHDVYLSEYWIGKYEVTRGEYREFIEAGGYSNPEWWSSEGWAWKVLNNRTEPGFWAAVQNFGSGAFTQTEYHPVVGVTYYEAEAFCAWAGGRLPTEAQWEKAARWTGSYPNVYPWGNVWDPERCNNGLDNNPLGGGYQVRQTAPVGSYPAGESPYGCQDMAGNVHEWCSDWYSREYYAQTPSGGWVDPPGAETPSIESYRVYRGGGFIASTEGTRCASRQAAFLFEGRPDDGFRLAR